MTVVGTHDLKVTYLRAEYTIIGILVKYNNISSGEPPAVYTLL